MDSLLQWCLTPYKYRSIFVVKKFFLYYHILVYDIPSLKEKREFMKRVWKKVTALGIGATLVATTSLLSPTANAAANKHSVFAQEKVQALQEKLNEPKASLFSEDTFVVKYNPSFSVNSVKGNGKDFDVIQTVGKLQYMVIKVRQKSNLSKVMTTFQKNSKVLSVNRSALYKTSASLGDPKVKDQYQLSLLKIADAQKLAGKNKITVAVIDTGVDKNHPELKGIFSKDSYNVINPMDQGTPDVHGTHVTGIIAAKKGNGIGGYGINPNVNILSIDVFDRGMFTTDYTIVQAILYATQHGAKVINMSLGSTAASPLLEEAVEAAIAKGVTIVAAAGNDGSETPNYPASYEGVIGVGSVNKDKQLSYFSTYGPSLDIVAPGENIYAPIYDYEKKSSFETLSGTSMASPMVAGTASLLLSKYPNLKPEQVEYILEHTATNLGPKGYDLKYGNGLVNPTAALKYNVKNLPSFVKSDWTKKEIIEKAETVQFSDSITRTGYITKPFEQKWYQFKVVKGEYIQTLLTSASEYDNKMMLHFYSDDASQSQTIDVNNVGAGKREGKLVQAPFTGTVAIGVKDVNGNYDDSAAKKSTFKLSINRTMEQPQDESSFESPIQVAGLPYQSDPLKLLGDNGDDDFFTFKTNDEQVVKISLSGIVGVDSSVQVYTKETLGLPTDDGTNPDQPAGDDPVPIDQIPPDWQSNSGGIGEGETLTIPTNPQTEYYVKVTNKTMAFFKDMFQMNNSLSEPQSSFLSYSLKMEGKVLPPDEDNLPIMDGGPGSNPYDQPVDYYQMILNNALPYSLDQKVSGYIQTPGDEDYYTIQPSKTGIYQFQLTGPVNKKPYVEILHIKNDKDDQGNPTMYAEPIGSNEPMDFFSTEMNSTIYTGLKKGETYLLHFMGNPYDYSSAISMDPYTLETKLVVSNVGDKYEDNDGPDHIKNLPASTFEGNFAMPNDEDLFYLEGKRSSVYSLLFESGKPSADLLRKYPKELLSDIFGVAIIFEDVNKNRKIDDADIQRESILAKSLYTGSSTNYGSFKVTKGKNYIVDLIGLVNSSTPLSLVPYKVSIAPVAEKDEDAGSVVKNNVPSKPLSLKKVNAKTWTATGQLNSNVAFGDQDWYVLDVKKSLTGYISFDTGKEVDGVISLYHNGKRISLSDYYGAGQTEMMPVQLKKGKYYIKVNDMIGNSTIKPYTLKVTSK
jgi:cell wall-associated protease